MRGLSSTAGVSTKTFYECFANVEQCFVATYGRIVRDALAQASMIECEDLQERVRARVRASFEAFAAEPKAAHLVLVESFSVGSVGLDAARSAAKAFERLLGNEFAMPPNPVSLTPPSVAQGIVGAAVRVARHRLLVESETDVGAVADELAALDSRSPQPEPGHDLRGRLQSTAALARDRDSRAAGRRPQLPPRRRGEAEHRRGL